jgi:hypothetical protein
MVMVVGSSQCRAKSPLTHIEKIYRASDGGHLFSGPQWPRSIDCHTPDLLMRTLRQAAETARGAFAYCSL